MRREEQHIATRTLYTYPMHIRNQEKLAEFSQKHPNSKSALDRWLELMERENFRSIVELREKFPHADPVRVKVQRRQSVGIHMSIDLQSRQFSTLAATKRSLIVSMQYQFQRVTVHKVLTHAEYDKWNRSI